MAKISEERKKRRYSLNFRNVAQTSNECYETSDDSSVGEKKKKMKKKIRINNKSAGVKSDVEKKKKKIIFLRSSVISAVAQVFARSIRVYSSSSETPIKNEPPPTLLCNKSSPGSITGLRTVKSCRVHCSNGAQCFRVASALFHRINV